MSDNPKNIVEIKKKIQNIISKLMSNSQDNLDEEENKLIEQICKYRVANKEELTRLSKEFDKVLDSDS